MEIVLELARAVWGRHTGVSTVHPLVRAENSDVPPRGDLEVIQF